jgi:hypothetical protein
MRTIGDAIKGKNDAQMRTIGDLFKAKNDAQMRTIGDLFKAKNDAASNTISDKIGGGDASQLDTVIGKIRESLDRRNQAIADKIDPKVRDIEFPTLRKSVDALIDQAHERNRLLGEYYLPAEYAPPDLGLVDFEPVPVPMNEEQRTILLTTGEHVEATARLMGTLVTLTEDAYSARPRPATA